MSDPHATILGHYTATSANLKLARHRESQPRLAVPQGEGLEERQSVVVRRAVREKRGVRQLLRGRNHGIEPQEIVAVEDAERSVDDRKNHLELEPRRASRPEVRHADGLQLGRELEVRELARNAAQRGGRELELVGAQDERRADVHEGRQGDRAGDGYPVFEIRQERSIAARELKGIVREPGERPTGAWPSPLPVRADGRNLVALTVPVADLPDGRKETHGTDGVDVETSDVILAAHVDARKRRWNAAAETRDGGRPEMEGKRIPPVIDGMKVFRLNHGLDGVDVSAQHASREAQGRVEVSPGRDVQLAAVQGVIKKRRRNLAAGDSPQLAGALELSEGERLEERLGRRVEGLDAAHRKAVGQADAAEAAVQRIADKSGKPGGVLLEVLEELPIAHLLQGERVETRNRSRLTKLVEMIIALENGESRGNG